MFKPQNILLTPLCVSISALINVLIINHSGARTGISGTITSWWRHNERDGVSNYRRLDYNSTICSCADQRKHQSSASLAFVMGIHRGPVDSPHKGPVTRKLFPHLMTSSWFGYWCFGCKLGQAICSHRIDYVGLTVPCPSTGSVPRLV